MTKTAPKTRLFNITLILVKIEAALAVLLVGLVAFSAIAALLEPNSPNSWDGLGDFVMVFGAGLTVVIAFPLIMAAISGSRYKNGENEKGVTSCITWAIFALVANLGVISFLTPNVSSSSSFSLKDNTDSLRVLFFAISMFVTEMPLLAFLAGCLLEKNKKYAKMLIVVPSVIIAGIIIFAIVPMISIGSNIKKIPASEAKLDTLGDFKRILRDRGFVYDNEPGMKELTTMASIAAVEPSYQYTRNYSVDLDTDMEKKFSFYTYEGYASLIKKSNKTESYYTKGPADWWISWNIYDSNGQIFAAVSEESMLGSVSQNNIFSSSPIQIVAEKETITTYNWKGNYFVEGGCISDTRSTQNRMLFPEMHDSANGHSCGDVYVVDRVDADTLDELAKEIARRHYRSSNPAQ